MRNTVLVFLFFLVTALALSPTGQILLYPNTEASPSLYLLAFTTLKDLEAGEYLLINMNWLSHPIDPHHCILVNTTIDISCTNLGTPQFALTFTYDTMLLHNPQLDDDTTMVVQLQDALPANTNYYLQISLYSNVANLNKISPSVQFYTIDENGLVYEENLNFGSVIYKPPITDILDVSVLNDQSSNQPGELSTLRVEINISIPISTSYSTLFFVLQEPFKFMGSSYLRTYESEEYTSNPIALNSPAPIAFFQVKTPNIFYAVFDETFVSNRKFIVEITEISNPFQIAQSNISIYSADFNSLTPLEGYETFYILNTVTYDLDVELGLPYDMPREGPCVIYKNSDNYLKVTFNMPKDVPEGYAIKVAFTEMTIREGTAYVNFESLAYTTVYEYPSSTSFVMKSMGPIYEGARIQILFKASKDGDTIFYVEVYIDTQQIIDSSTASSYMFYGRVDDSAEDVNYFFNNVQDSYISQPHRVSTYLPSGQNFRIQIYPYTSHSVHTSAGSYIEFYLPPFVEFQSDFDPSTDCRMSSTANSGHCEVNKTSNFVHIIFTPSDSYSSSTPNAFPSNIGRDVYIYNIKFPRTSSNKYPFPMYMRLFNSSAVNPTTYIQIRTISVVNQRDQISGFKLQQHNNVYNKGFQYPGFLRFQSTNTTAMNFVLQENEKRIITVLSRYGIAGMGDIQNQQPYPCVSNIQVQCQFRSGYNSYDHLMEWEHVNIFFPSSQQNTTNFHIILPDTVITASSNQYHYMLGVYNQLTKDIKYSYRSHYYQRTSGWQSSPVNLNTNMMIDLQGKSGSYRNNVSITVAGSLYTGNYNFLVISSAWMLFENGLSAYTTETNNLNQVNFYTDELSPLSVLMGDGMYLTVIPFTCTTTLSTFTMWIDNLHMPYHYDLPNYYIYVISPSGNQMISYNVFEMTNANVFYSTPLNSLTFDCDDVYLGALNTRCTVVFGTQNPLKADGSITLVFAGMNVATDTCHVYLPNGTQVDSTCSSTEDNRNVTIHMTDTESVYHYPADNFTLEVRGVSIEADSISQSMTIYLQDSTTNYVIQTGTRILTTTIASPATIEIDQITYSYGSPLSANTLSIKFYLPRSLYADERLGFVMGKDLSDVNLQINRLKIVLTRNDGTVIQNLNELISDEYKVLFTFRDSSLVIASNYTLQIFGIMTPASHENGAFSIIYQRTYDETYTLTNEISTSFPTFEDPISSNITLEAYFNTEGAEQLLEFTIYNQELAVDDEMVWLVNFPSYYYQQLFNGDPYCMIDDTPIECTADPTTPYQLLITNSPKIISKQTAYVISVYGLACPRSLYTNDYYPSRYMFVGILKTSTSTVYSQTALIYPQQNIQQSINGIISISDIPLTNAQQSAFSTLYITLICECNVDIVANSYLYVIFPSAFDNFNNLDISIVMKADNVVINNGAVPVVNRMLEIAVATTITAGQNIKIDLPSLPTPKVPGDVAMSEMKMYVTTSNRKSIYAGSSKSSNSAPILTFVMDDRYISFNNDQTITITAGTYSPNISITSSDGNPFLTNILVNMSSAGFTFQPAEVFLSLGDQTGTFRIGADSGLLPISYFYDTSKTQQVTTFYTITKGNNIQVTNIPVSIVLPVSIDIPAGGCSTPMVIDVVNAPYTELAIAYTYDNQMYDDDTFWPNEQITNTELTYNSTVTINSLSFCVVSTLPVGTSFTLTMTLTGVDYLSYQFTPSQNITINIINSINPPTPTVSLALHNPQKSFMQINITTNVDGNVYYHFQLGDNVKALDEAQLKMHIKNHNHTLESMEDFLTTRMYTADRDWRLGHEVYNAGTHIMNMTDILPQRDYTMCVYLQTYNNQISEVVCESYQSKQWGAVIKAKVTFSSTLTSEDLNKVLCFFTKEVSTQIMYMVDLEGNSCYDRAVQNVFFNYSGEVISREDEQTYIYLFTNPNQISDPSPSAFKTLFDDANDLTSAAKLSAISGFFINYLDAQLIGESQAIDMLSQTNPDLIAASFNQPSYSRNEIRVDGIKIEGGIGTIYFLLVLYKQIVITDSDTHVNIKLNSEPTVEQMLNCENWEGVQAEGCARAIYSGKDLSLTFTGIEENSTYLLYYTVASEYPLRPIVSSNILYDTVLTFNFLPHFYLFAFITALIMLIL